MLDDHTIEVVRGRLGDDRAAEVLDFWSRHGVLDGEAARRRLPELVCVLRHGGGEVVGVNSVYADDVALVGGRRFWLYRRFLAGGVPDDAEPAMLNAAFDALHDEFRATGGGPVGLCLLVDDPEVMRRHREAVWPETCMYYAGYDAGRQVRIRYFDDASI